MLPRHVALLAPALRPALLAAHKALQPGPTDISATTVAVLPLLLALQRADDATAAALREVGRVVDNQATADSEVFAIGAMVACQIDGLIAACRACQSLRLPQQPAGRELADIARDTLVSYAHFLTDLIFATADPAAAIRENEAVQVAGTHFEISLTCSTNIPDSLDALAGWVAGRFNFDDVRCRRVLKLAERPLVYRPREVDLPQEPAELPGCPVKPMSFWSIVGWVGLLSLLFGHDHCDCGD